MIPGSGSCWRRHLLDDRPRVEPPLIVQHRPGRLEVRVRVDVERALRRHQVMVNMRPIPTLAIYQNTPLDEVDSPVRLDHSTSLREWPQSASMADSKELILNQIFLDPNDRVRTGVNHDLLRLLAVINRAER